MIDLQCIRREQSNTEPPRAADPGHHKDFRMEPMLAATSSTTGLLTLYFQPPPQVLADLRPHRKERPEHGLSHAGRWDGTFFAPRALCLTGWRPHHLAPMIRTRPWSAPTSSACECHCTPDEHGAVTSPTIECKRMDGSCEMYTMALTFNQPQTQPTKW